MRATGSSASPNAESERQRSNPTQRQLGKHLDVRGWLARGWDDALLTGGSALFVSAAVTSVLGFMFWVAAARLYPPAELGENAVLLSTLVTIASIGQLNLGALLIRYLPVLPARAGRWLLLGVGVAGTLVSLLLSLGFAASHDWWLPQLSQWDTGLALWFITGVVCWTLFSLLDSALVGFRRARWVPVKNGAFALGKLILVLLLAQTALAQRGPFLAWTISALFLLSVSALTTATAIRPKQAADPGKLETNHVVRYFVGDTLGEIAFFAAAGIAPILVVREAGTAAAATYYLCWTVTWSLYLFADAMAVSLVAEGSADPRSLVTLTRKALAYTFGVLTLVIVAVAIASPGILLLLGSQYLDEGVRLLVTLAFSALPFGITSVVLGMFRVQGRMNPVAAANGALLLSVLGLGITLLPSLGVWGMGVTWLISQSLVALGVCVLALWLHRKAT